MRRAIHAVTLALLCACSFNQFTAHSLSIARDRYVATNRFTVRKNKFAQFEQRWATRKSRLATLDGFKYFHLMKRVELDEMKSDAESFNDQFDYVSFTVWQEKKHFNAWRQGDAFKEAHGGTSIFAFLSTMLNSAMVLEGAPKPAFYDGLLFQSTPPSPDAIPELVDGWRNVEADGVNLLPTECFVACNQFSVAPGMEEAFEKRWADRESMLKECDGFVSFSMLRRDAKAKGHGITPLATDEPNYMSCTIWRDRAAFQGWRDGQAFKTAHGSGEKESKAPQAAETKAAPQAAAPPMWTSPPKPIFYEGKLVITSTEGA